MTGSTVYLHNSVNPELRLSMFCSKLSWGSRRANIPAHSGYARFVGQENSSIWPACTAAAHHSGYRAHAAASACAEQAAKAGGLTEQG